MGLFDDLIPEVSAPTSEPLFDDLIPKAPDMPLAPSAVPSGLASVIAPATPDAPVAAPMPVEVEAPPPMGVAGLFADLAPDTDGSSALADLTAGWLQLQQFGPGRQVMSGTRDIMSGEHRIATTQTFGSELDQLNAQIAEIEATLAAPRTRETRLDPQVRRDMEAQIFELSNRRNQLGLTLGAGGVEASMAEAQGERDAGAQAVTEGALRIGELNDQIAQIPMNPAAARGLGPEASWGDVGQAILDDPYGVFRTFGLRSLPASAPTIGAAVVGQLVGGPGAAAAAAGGATYQTEQALSIANEISGIMAQSGVDTTNPDEVGAYIAADPQMFSEMLSDAMVRAGIISAADALTAGLVGRVATATSGMGRGARVATAAGAGTVLEPAGEASGEALAQLATTGEIQPGEVAAEAIGGLALGGPTAVAQTVAEASRTPGRVLGREFGRLVDETQLDATQPAITTEAAPRASRAAPTPPAQPAPEPARAAPTAPSTQPTPLIAAPAAPRAPEVVDEPPAPANPERRSTVYTPDNKPIEVEYQVVEADSVLTSDQAGFDQGAQPRGRDGNKNSELQIESIANSPNFARLYRAPETDRGAPVVGPDGLVESGNGRVMGLRRAYERGTADEFRAALEADFPEAVGMARPIIVARRMTDVNREDFAVQSNRPATMALSATEEARAEARLIDKDILNLYRSGPLTAAGNRDMVRAFISKLPATEQNRMLNPEGGLSVDGMRRVQAAVVSRAYDDPDLLSRMAEAVDDDMKGITSVLTDLAPRVARMRDAMERGEIAAEGDFTPALIEAVRQIANIRSRGENLSDFKAQIDAFADPLGEDVRDIMDAMFNPAGTRLASKKAVADFIEFAIDAAEAQDATTETLPGVESVPTKQSPEIVKDAKRKAEADQDQTALFDGPPKPRGRAAKGGAEEQRTADGGGREADQRSSQQERVADAAPSRARPGGRLSPTFMEFAYTNRPSVFDHAFRAAGIDPDDAKLMPVEDQIAAVKKAVTDTFGINVELPTITVRRKNMVGRKVTDQKHSLQSRKALDQLLNAYRQLQMLAHIMGVPEKAVGLPIQGQPLTLSLVKGKHLRGALGMFSWGNGKRTISLADMSNSFAHEWGHALDHYLSVMADRKALKGMLSREMSGQGVIPPLSPKRALTDAFAHVMWSMMGRSSAAGEVTIRLQVESAQLGADGKPTPKAKRAQKILTDIREGRTPPREYLSDYFKTSKAFDDQVQGDGYFTDPAEMFARAFEAMVAHKVGQISGQPQAFLSKGDFGGTSDARLNLTFPKDVDLAQFTLAMGNLQHAMARMNLHGPDAPALAPNTHDIHTTKELLKDVKGSSLSVLSQREVAEWGRTLDMMKDMPGSAKRTADNIASGTRAFYSQVIRTSAATMYATADRQTNPKAKEAFTNIARMVGKRPGSGQLQENIWEEGVRSRAAVYVNKVDGALRKAVKGPVRRLRQQDMRDVRALLAGDQVDAKPEIRRLATDLRKILDDIWYDLDSAGVEIGYASGYLPHRYDPQKASENPEKFRAQAAKVYELMFEREIVGNQDEKSQLSDINAVIRGLRGAMQAMPDGDATPRPRLSPDDEGMIEVFRKERKRLKDLQRKQKKSDDPDKYEDKIAEQAEVVQDAMDEMLDMLRTRWSEYSAEKWLNKIRTGNLDDYGSIGPTASFLKGRKLPNEAGSYMREFMEDNPIQMITAYAFDAARRSEYAKAFGPNNEKLENMLLAAEGATREDVELMKQAVAATTGRINRVMSGFQHFKTTTFSLGTMNMLTMASFSSLAEPITAGLRSGQVRDSFRAMAELVRNLVQTGRRRDLQELSRTIGLIMPYAQDALMQNRMGMDVLNNRHWLNETVGRFFVLNGLTPLTHYQRTTQVPVANAILLRHLRADVEGKRGLYGRTRDAIDGEAGGFSNGELNELGIPKDDRADLLKWIDDTGGMPSPEDLFGPDGEMHKAAELWSRAVHRLASETIQDPLKSDRPMLANDPNHAAMYGIMSFIDAFTRNVIFRTLERGMKEGDGTAAKGAKMTANVALAASPALTLVLGHILFGVLREALLNREELEKQIEEGTALEWLVFRGAERSGLSGRLSPLINLMTGLRYETDLTTMFAGPYIAYFLGNLQRVLRAAAGRNAASTNSGEFTAAEGIYRLFVKVPATTIAAAYAPGGPVSSNMARAAIGYLAHGSTEDNFAEALVGEKGAKHVGDPPWWEMGDGVFQ